MARRKANDLENQMSLMDMMASESPEYTEEGPEELLDPGEDTGDSDGQTDKPFKLVANNTTKAKASISTQALSVVKAIYADTVETNWEELFDGFDRLYAITFSSGIEFVNKVINKFSYAEVVFGCEKIIATDIAAIMSVQIDSVQRLAKSKSAGNLANRLDDGSLQLYVSRDTKSHEKIFILESADHKRVRVITGSANMSASAFCGIQRENIVCFDDEAAFAHYKVLFETFKETCSDNVSYKAVVSTMNQEDYLKENIKEVPVFQSIEKQKLIFLEQAQPEDEVEYEIVADVKKMQELVKPIIPKMPVQANRIVVAAEPMRVFTKRYTEVRRVAAEATEWIRKQKITKVMMNPPYERRYGCATIVGNVLDSVPAGTKCAFILPDKKMEKESKLKALLERHTLTTIIKLPENLFFGLGVTTSIFIFETGKPQNGRNIKGYYVADDGLETVKNKGRQDVHDKWPSLEDYWVKAIQDDNDDRYNTRQLINPAEHLSYQMPEKPFELYEEDFIKAVIDYEMYKRGINAKEFGDKLLQKVLYGSTVTGTEEGTNILVEKGEDNNGED